ncbi:hypothetical protein [Marinitoga lauensis]|uniref:hypothetical protein n=1 Tax=Marinitoga lauensis TaxID=2201189 RepID=UPI001404D894|nr:hypothetical protein [Marinitoga lauensis]
MIRSKENGYISFYENKVSRVYLFILPPFGVNTYVITTNRTIIVIDPGKFNRLIFNFLI